MTGGAIGVGMPAAVGAAVACPDRRVLNLQADGSAMYTVQSLWTQARERLDVTTVILSNRSYAILNVEMARVQAKLPGAKAGARSTSQAPSSTSCSWRVASAWRPCVQPRRRSSRPPSGAQRRSRGRS